MSNYEFILITSLGVSYLLLTTILWSTMKEINEQLNLVKRDVFSLQRDVKDLSKTVRRHGDEIQVLSEKIFKDQK
jgi:hypothetical protein